MTVNPYQASPVSKSWNLRRLAARAAIGYLVLLGLAYVALSEPVQYHYRTYIGQMAPEDLQQISDTSKLVAGPVAR